ncbi:hypothetical protein [Pontibacillus yanchengensis]|uniref:hypothetical protein n=1 Tax=Pontibacillus yanchengensis TaxID=462910 RepID=UPI000AD00B26|nr:hypothetical protein [Pontibacillus yanchengensis]
MNSEELNKLFQQKKIKKNTQPKKKKERKKLKTPNSKAKRKGCCGQHRATS